MVVVSDTSPLNYLVLVGCDHVRSSVSVEPHDNDSLGASEIRFRKQFEARISARSADGLDDRGEVLVAVAGGDCAVED
jgi:hypothetical protein